MKAVAYYHMSIWKTVDIFRICKKLHILVEEPFILYGIDGFFAFVHSRSNLMGG